MHRTRCEHGATSAGKSLLSETLPPESGTGECLNLFGVRRSSRGGPRGRLLLQGIPESNRLLKEAG